MERPLKQFECGEVRSIMRLFEGTQFDVPPRCERCEELETDCQCPPLPEPDVVVAPQQQTLKIRVEKRKRGKIVTVISGLANDSRQGDVLTLLKNHCGSGGTIKDDNLEIQGDHQERLVVKLKDLGYRVSG
jgi:translation initiation factor 1